MADNSDDEAGYGRPPKKHRFTKGQSGNPRGRPKNGKLTQAQIVARVRDEPVTITIEGKPKTVTKFEATILQVFNTTFKKGNPRDLKLLTEILEKHGAPPFVDEAVRAKAGADAVLKKIRTIFDRTQAPDTPEIIDRTQRNDAEFDLVFNCSSCTPELERRWAEEDKRRKRGWLYTELRERFNSWKRKTSPPEPDKPPRQRRSNY